MYHWKLTKATVDKIAKIVITIINSTKVKPKYFFEDFFMNEKLKNNYLKYIWVEKKCKQKIIT